MGRRRVDFDHATKSEIAARTARGESADTVTAVLQGRGLDVSRATIARMQASMRLEPPPATPEAPADVPDEVPTDAPLTQIEEWIAAVNRGIKRAEEAKNMAAVASLLAKGSQLATLRHKVTPAPRADPNDDPDFAKLALEGEAKLLQLAREFFPLQ